MYLKSLVFNNYGPISRAELAPRLTKIGTPVPLVVVGANGSGKTYALSLVLDAFVNIRNRIFAPGTDADEGKLFKPLTHNIRTNELSEYSFAQAAFSTSLEDIVFHEAVFSPNADGKFKAPSDFQHPPGFDYRLFRSRGVSKSLSETGDELDSLLRRSLLAYYPAVRAERPGWLGENARVDFDISPRYSDSPSYAVWRTDLVEQIGQWILDVVLDAELYDKQNVTATVEGRRMLVSVPAPGMSRNILGHLNRILSDIVRHGHAGYTQARIGIDPRVRGGRSVRVFAKRSSGDEVVIANQLQDLSAGELMVFCLFADLIKLAELSGWNGKRIEDIRGIVLVDELDLHLHIRLQKEVVPALIKTLRGVQFIFTTHSPFLVLGMAAGEVDIVRMPQGTQIEAEEFEEFSLAYQTFMSKEQTHLSQLAALREKVANESRPLIVTEGKTDWGHLKNALRRSQETGEFPDLEVEFFETVEDMGDGELLKCLKAFQMVPPARAMVCLFDRDKQDIVKKITGGVLGISRRGAVVGMCLEVPEHRKEQQDVSVEHLYKDETLQTCIPGTEKRLRFAREIGYRADRQTAFLLPNPDGTSRKIVDRDVERIGRMDGSDVGKVAISKTTFLQKVILSADGEDIDLDGFRPTFEKIRDVLLKLRDEETAKD